MIAVLLVSTEEHALAFRREDVELVTLYPRLERRPSDIDLVEGWLRLGGTSVPTISLAKILGLAAEPPQLSDHLVLSGAGGRVAWRVRRVLELDEVRWDELSMIEHSAEPTPCYVASFERAGQTVFLLNVSGLMLAEERERLRQAAERKQARLEALKGGETADV